MPNGNSPMPTNISGMRIESTALATESRFDGNTTRTAKAERAEDHAETGLDESGISPDPLESVLDLRRTRGIVVWAIDL